MRDRGEEVPSYGMPTIWASVSSLVLAVAMFGPPLAWADEAPSGRQSVLLLYAESRALPAIVSVDASVRARFAAAGVQADFFAEYLDLSGAASPRYTAELLTFLRAKYRQRTFDLVIVVGSPALRFTLVHRAELFPGVPLVFCAVTAEGTSDLQLGPDVTGVWMVPEAAATVAVAMRLQPTARRLVVVTGASPLDNVFRADVQRDLAGRTADLEVTYLSGLPLDRLREQLRDLPRTAIVLFVSMLQDGGGRSLSSREALAQLGPSSGAPIYGLSDTLLGHGIVGGRIISFESQGAHAADLALRVLAGEAVSRISPMGTLANRDVFDWRELRRWGLHERDVSPGAVLLNRVPSLWELYRYHIVATVVLIAAQGGLIGALLIHRRRRRHAEAALQERLDFETFVSGLSACLVDQPGADADAAIERGLQRMGERLGLESVIAMETAADDAMRVTHAWTASPAAMPTTVGERLRFPWLVERLGQGHLQMTTLEELPPEAAIDRDSFVGLEVSSAIVVPLMDGPSVMGAMTFSVPPRASRRPRDLPARLEFVASMFSSLLLRRRSEIELQNLRRDLMHVGRVSTMGELAVSLAHELNQPLTAILTNGQVAERLLDSGRAEPKELREIVGEIVADDKRAGEVIRRLRGFVKKDPPRRSPIDLNTVIQDVVLLLHSDAIIRNVTVALDFAPDLPRVRADRVQLQQVILNLMMNGLDAMRGVEDRRLGIATRLDEDGNLQVTISDRGIGIPERDLKRIFDAFYTTKPHGLGMGLSIARSLIEAHGGRLWASNNAERGATFAFTLPPARGSGDETKV
jgi:signal transduction histidine kinase